MTVVFLKLMVWRGRWQSGNPTDRRKDNSVRAGDQSGRLLYGSDVGRQAQRKAFVRKAFQGRAVNKVSDRRAPCRVSRDLPSPHGGSGAVALPTSIWPWDVS